MPARAPAFAGRSIEVLFRANLRTSRGRLYTGVRARRLRGGNEVHAATFIRRRRMVLDSALLSKRAELRRIVIHELFHFAWVRMNNRQRRAWGTAIRRELSAHARGELGWSSEMRKQALRARSGRCWREYLCESFCDTAAWLYAGVKRHDEFTLTQRFRRLRAAWFETAFAGRAIPV